MSTRLLDAPGDLESAVGVVVGVWGEPAATLAPASLLRTYSHYGNPVIGAIHDGRLCGVSIGFLASTPRVHLHSHITGVLPTHQHLGIGYALKDRQRRWCADRGIDLVTWTFDPMLARNAHFNLRKLGAVARRLLPSFYGSMDDDINRGDDTDRLAVEWHLDPTERRAAPVTRTVAIPDDYLAVRGADPARAAAVRAAVRDQLLAAFDEGLEVVDFDRGAGYCLSPAV